jgi:membrane associated rhomboid family serine protease
MDRFLARLERRLGGLAIENLTTFLVGGMAIVYVLTMLRPEFVTRLDLYPPAIAHGEVWRLVTYLFVPPRWASPIWFALDMYILWMIGSNLESEWGAFKLNVYYGIGAVGTTVAALVTHAGAGNLYLNASLALAFATLFPAYEILLFFIIPVQMRWLGWLLAAFLAYQLVRGDWPDRAAIVAAVANYLLFFTTDIARFVGGAGTGARLARRREAMASERPAAPVDARSCALCGKTASDGADIRVCSCDKCKEATGGKPRTLCLEHARSH